MEAPARLPKSLDALRVFEAAARHMNFTAAAAELLVTQAAVSRRVQALEAALGFSLFERAGRRLALTPRGEVLFARVRAALDYLDESLEALRPDHATRAVTIAASGSVSHLWLGDRLRDYALTGAADPVRLLTTDSPAEAAAEANDLCILYAAGPEHPRWSLVPILPERLAPVASAAHLAQRGIAPADLPLPLARLRDLRLLDYDRVRPQWVTLERWFARMGAGPMPPPARVFNSYFMAVEAAVAGEGAMLGSLALLDGRLRSGALLRLTAEEDATGFAYHLGLKRRAAATDAALRLFQWLGSVPGAGLADAEGLP